jgi:hypothetical protein
MHLGIAITLGGRSMKIPGAILSREVQGVDCTRRAHGKSFNAKTVVIDRAGRRGKVINEIYFAEVEWFANILLYKTEIRFPCKMFEIVCGPCAEIVYANNNVPLGQQGVTEM